MKKCLKWLVGVVVFLLSNLVMKSSIVYAQDESNIIAQLYEEKSETFYKNQTQSIIQYNQLLNNIKIGTQGLSDTASVAWNRNATLAKEKNCMITALGDHI